MKQINLTFRESIFKKLHGSGSYGKYIKIDKKNGVKIIGEGYAYIEYLLDSDCWELANEEADFYQMVKDSNFTPKYAKVQVVTIGNKLYPGIVMEHLEGETLAERCESSYDGSEYVLKNGRISKANHYYNLSTYDIRKEVSNHFNKTLMKKYKIYHEDVINPKNIIVSKNGKIKLIDFSPDYIQKVTKSKKWKKILDSSKKWKPFF